MHVQTHIPHGPSGLDPGNGSVATRDTQRRRAVPRARAYREGAPMHDAESIRRIVQSHSGRDMAYLAGYVLRAMEFDETGRIIVHTVMPIDQNPEITARLHNPSQTPSLEP
jgi:hypothetical protein